MTLAPISELNYRMLDRLRIFGSPFFNASLVAVAVTLVAGCSLPATLPVQADTTTTLPAPVATVAITTTAAVPILAAPLSVSDRVTPLLAYADYVYSLQGEALAQERNHLGEPVVPADQLRLALVLSQTRQLYDLARAQALLQRVLLSPREDARELKTLARLLTVRFTEQRRVEDLLDRQNLQLRELQRRLDQTQEKLDALKEIERSLSRRPAGGVTAPPVSRARAPGS
jgi:hypothetical protein